MRIHNYKRNWKWVPASVNPGDIWELTWIRGSHLEHSAKWCWRREIPEGQSHFWHNVNIWWWGSVRNMRDYYGQYYNILRFELFPLRPDERDWGQTSIGLDVTVCWIIQLYFWNKWQIWRQRHGTEEKTLFLCVLCSHIPYTIYHICIDVSAVS